MDKKKFFRLFLLLGISICFTISCKKERNSIPVVTTNMVKSVTVNSAECGGEVSIDGGETVVERGVCWSTSENPTINDSKTIDGDGLGPFTSSIADLTANTTYYIRAYATNGVGTAYGQQENFTTINYKLPVLTTTPISNISITTATGGGNISSDGGAQIVQKGICWSTSQNPTISDSKTENGNGTGQFISNMTTLYAGTTYYIRAYATNAVGTAYGDQVTFKTSDNILRSYDEITRNDIVIIANRLSKTIIMGTDASGHLLEDYDVIIYKTNSNRYGKLQILGIDDLLNKKLTIKAVTYNDDGTVYSHAENLSIRGTFLCDLDNMLEIDVNADFKWNRSTTTDSDLRPISPALFLRYK